MSREGLATPIVLIVFNRPEPTARVFEIVKAMKPQTLLIIADGPRPSRPNEREKCQQTRNVIENGIDWECSIHRNYSDSNLGCKARVSSGLDWVFQTVEEAIILEDDCLPDTSFFQFCSELLSTYRHDERVFSIGGTNPVSVPAEYRSSYYCAQLPQIWGWATWRRSWKLYDPLIKQWPELRKRDILKPLLKGPRRRYFWTNTFNATHLGQIDTWDYQLAFASIINHKVNLIPTKNLISNIGFNQDATHTTKASGIGSLPRQNVKFPLDHPKIDEPVSWADKYFQNQKCRVGVRGTLRYLWHLLRSRTTKN